MNKKEENPFRTVESFERFLAPMNCLGCKYLEVSDKPISELKCTHDNAYKAYDVYDNGFEGDKDEIRELDIKRNYNRDVNEYFICISYKEKEDGNNIT